MAVIEAPGVHKVRVVQHQLGKSGTGTPHIAVLFEDTVGDRITWYGYLSDKALDRTIASLEVLGCGPAEYDGRIESLNGTGILADREAEIVVEVEKYNSKPSPKVKWVNRPGGGMGEAMAPEEAAAFSATLRQRILSAKGPKVNAKPGPARQPAGAGAGKPLSEPDDGLPF